MSRHTPGPWQRNGSYLYGPDPQRLVIAQMSYIGSGYQEEIEANHNLILAAPELFGLLKYLRNYARLLDLSPDTEARMDAAIAKAEGVPQMPSDPCKGER